MNNDGGWLGEASDRTTPASTIGKGDSSLSLPPPIGIAQENRLLSVTTETCASETSTNTVHAR
jgi:hypothetical protein